MARRAVRHTARRRFIGRRTNGRQLREGLTSIFDDESLRLLACSRERYGNLVASDAVSRAMSAACHEAVPISQETLDFLGVEAADGK
jgi:hypothetical protein